MIGAIAISIIIITEFSEMDRLEDGSQSIAGQMDGQCL